MPGESFKMVEQEDEEEEEVHYSCWMIIIDIDFGERNIKIRQKITLEATRSSPSIAKPKMSKSYRRNMTPQLTK